MNNILFSNYYGDAFTYIVGTQLNFTNPSSILSYILKNIFLINNVPLFLNLIFICITIFIIQFGMKKMKPPFPMAMIIFFTTAILFAPIRQWYQFEWANHANWGFLIGWLIFTINYYIQGGKSNLYYSILFYSLALWNTPYQGIMVLSMFLPFVIFDTMKSKSLQKSLKLGIGYVATSLLVLLVTSNQYINSGTGIKYIFSRNELDKWVYSARPWNYITPDIFNPFLGDIAVKINYYISQSKPFYLTEPFFPKEHTLYLGLSLLLAAIYTIYIFFLKKSPEADKPLVDQINGENFKTRKTLLNYLIIVLFVSFLFSLPPYIGVNNFRIYFPSSVMYEIIPQVRAYARYGIFVFISLSLIATIGLEYLWITQKKNGKKIFGILIFLMIIEFINMPPRHIISTDPTPPYVWLAQQPGEFAYLEVPTRTDYSDLLYRKYHKKTILNPYLRTTNKKAKDLEVSLYNESFATPDNIWCNDFKEQNGKYIFYHLKEQNKNKVVSEFIQTGIVTEQLKVAMAESWGFPVWGTNAELPTDQKFKIEREKEMLELFLNEPKFKLVKHFTNDEIVNSRSIKNFSADKFDEVYVFEINEDYCNQLAQ